MNGKLSVKGRSVRINKRKNVLERTSGGEKVVYGTASVVLTLYCFLLLFPVLWMLMSSFKGTFEYNEQLGSSGTFSLPEKWIFSNYVDAFTSMKVPTRSGDVGLLSMLVNSVWMIACTVGIGVFFSAIVGYILSKYRFKGRNFIYSVIIICMTIPIIGTTGAFYRLIGFLGLYDNPLYYLFTSVNAWGFNFLVFYGFFKNVSWYYAEAVFIDGGKHSTAFFEVILPQAKGVIVTLCIMGAIGAWNDYTTPLLYMPSYPTMASGVWVLSASLLRFGKQPLYFAALIIVALPMLVLYASCSKIIMNNLTMGGLKG